MGLDVGFASSLLSVTNSRESLRSPSIAIGQRITDGLHQGERMERKFDIGDIVIITDPSNDSLSDCNITRFIAEPGVVTSLFYNIVIVKHGCRYCCGVNFRSYLPEELTSTGCTV